MGRPPNVLVILTDQLRYPPAYESEELRQFASSTARAGAPAPERRLLQAPLSDGGRMRAEPRVAADRAVPVAAWGDPDRRAARRADSDDMFWLAPDTVPTLGDWFRAGGYRTYFKGKWHASHAHLDAEDGDGYLLSIDDDGDPERGEHPEVPARRICSTTTAFRSGSDPSRTGSASTTSARSRTRSPLMRRSTLLERFDDEDSDDPWLTVCSFLNPHDDSLLRRRRAGPGPALPPLGGAARRAGADPRRGPLDQARLPAELQRRVGARWRRRSPGSRPT